MDREYIGFASLPDQIHRKTIKKGFEFTLMVAGESGLGKYLIGSTLLLAMSYLQMPFVYYPESLI